ncbi:MAG: ABC transporter ATP-binding protein [Desulfovibrio sp.]
MIVGAEKREIIRLEGLGKVFALAGEESRDGNGAEEGAPARPRGVEVLRGIDLRIDAGEFVALQGTSGSGKSTLLHIIGLLDRATAGRYLLDGTDVSTLDDDALSDLRNQRLGFVFQSFYLIPYASALENVLLPGMYADKPQAELRARAAMLLERVGLGDRMEFKPSRLSGGQQQRVAMARALLNNPAVILADEPTGQLDSSTSAEILELFTEINASGTTIILVTHDEATAAAARRMIRLHDGRIAEDGN